MKLHKFKSKPKPERNQTQSANGMRTREQLHKSGRKCGMIDGIVRILRRSTQRPDSLSRWLATVEKCTEIWAF
jgi:hypothetical protein